MVLITWMVGDANYRARQTCFYARRNRIASKLTTYRRRMSDLSMKSKLSSGTVARLLGSNRSFAQSEVPHHRTKIAIVVQQRQPMLDAPCSDQKVDRLANGD